MMNQKKSRSKKLSASKNQAQRRSRSTPVDDIAVVSVDATTTVMILVTIIATDAKLTSPVILTTLTIGTKSKGPLTSNACPCILISRRATMIATFKGNTAVDGQLESIEIGEKPRLATQDALEIEERVVSMNHDVSAIMKGQRLTILSIDTSLSHRLSRSDVAVIVVMRFDMVVTTLLLITTMIETTSAFMIATTIGITAASTKWTTTESKTTIVIQVTSRSRMLAATISTSTKRRSHR